MALRALLLLFALVLSGCGYHLRGHDLKGVQFPFHSVYIKAPAETPFVVALRRSLQSYKLEVTQSPDKADLTLEIVSEVPEKQITALSAAGHVIEYLLRYRVSLRAYDKQQEEWLPAAEITLQRIFPYDDTQVLAKEQEEALLYRDMRGDLVQQVMRRLALAKPPQQPATP